MKTKLSILLTAIAGSVISAMPAQAFSFGTSGISFYEDTTVDFEFTRSYGRYKTDLRVYEVVDGEIFADLGLLFGEVKAADVLNADGSPTSDPLGTLGEGKAVEEGLASFTFEAGKEYTLGIVNYAFSQKNGTAPEDARYGIQYSTTDLNNSGTQRAVFGSKGGDELFEFGDASDFREGGSLADWLYISFDDGGNNNDKDYQDFTLKAKIADVESTPEPATLAGLGIVAGGMFLSRRKKQK